MAPEWITNNSELFGKNFFSWGGNLQSPNPLIVHLSMFTNSLMLLGSEEQEKKYLTLADNVNIIGCYA